MTRFPSHSNDPLIANDESCQQPTDGNVPRWNAEQISRLADHISAGEMQIPDDFSKSDKEVLLAEIHHRRRRRFIQFIARAIASDIYKLRGCKHGG